MQVLVRPNTTLPEVFDKVRSLESNDDKVAVLKKYNSKQLAWFVNNTYNFDFSKYTLPEYKKNNKPPEICYLTINKAINRIQAAVSFHNKGDMKRYEDLMTLVLEGISRAEAELLEDLFDNKKIDGISKTVWKKVFPEFFRTEEKAKSDQKED